MSMDGTPMLTLTCAVAGPAAPRKNRMPASHHWVMTCGSPSARNRKKTMEKTSRCRSPGSPRGQSSCRGRRTDFPEASGPGPDAWARAWLKLPRQFCPRPSGRRPAPPGTRRHEARGKAGVRGEVQVHVAQERVADPISLVALVSLAPSQPVHTGNRRGHRVEGRDRKSTRLNSSHGYISYAVFCLKKKK